MILSGYRLKLRRTTNLSRGNSWTCLATLQGITDYGTGLVALMMHLTEGTTHGIVIAEQEFDFLGNAHGPDVSILGAAKAALLELDKRVQRFVPDLAIEIASESDTYEGLLAKKDRYLRSGVSEVWLVSLRSREVAVYGTHRKTILRGKDMIETSLLPDFSIAVAQLLLGL